MPWTTITEADIEKLFAEREYAALKTKALNEGITDLIATTTANAVNLVRGYVAGCDGNVLNTGATVPDNLKSRTLDIIRFELLNRLGLNASDDRKESYRQAIRLLEQVSACKFAVSTADSPLTGAVQSGSAVSLVSSRDRLADKRQTDGLF